jgi:hypothetical protein
MKNLTLQLRLTSLLSLILLACTAAFGQITPLGDTYTNSGDPTTNYGAQKTLDVDAAKEITYIQFNLASVPTGASISQATLKLYVNTVATAGAFELYAVNGAWTESALTYSLAPALGSVIDSNVPITTADKNQYILVPMTSTVQGWLNTPSSNNGIALVAVGSFNATFDSKETTTTSHPPELDVVFAGDGTITGVTTASGSGLTGGGTSGTLNLSLTNACSANQVLQWNGTSWICAAVGTGTVTSVSSGAGLTGGPITGSGTLSLASNACASGSALSALPFTCSPFATLGANTFSANQTINGTVTATSSGTTITGNSTGSAGTGVVGNSTGGASTGVEGLSPFLGVYGEGTSGVYGLGSSGYGVIGQTTATSGLTEGVYGSTQSPAGYGVYGLNSATTGTTAAVYGTTSSTAGYGVAGTSPNVGVYGVSVVGSTEGEDTCCAGLWGDAGNQDYVGVVGTADDGFAGIFLSNTTLYTPLEVINETKTDGGGVFFGSMPSLLPVGADVLIGDPGCGESSGNMALQLGQDGMSGCSNYTLLGDLAGSTFLNALSGQNVHLRVANADVVKVSTGAVNITGTMSATGTKNFRIDHPLDPANKYLYHASIESSEVLNLYSGNAVLDDSGEAVVQLPDWFEVINKDFRYQLTNVGGFAPVYIAEEVSGGHFKIAGGKPRAKVSWQVSGVRNDAWEKAHPWAVEEDKGADRGHYLTPELYGAPETERIGYMPVPPGSEQVVHHRPLLPRRGNASPSRAPLSRPMPAPPMPAPPKIAALPHPAAQATQPEHSQK